MGLSLPPIRPRDISGKPFPPATLGGNQYGGAFVTLRPPQFEPPPEGREFIVSYSVLAAASATTALFVLDVNGNIVAPSCAVQLSENTVARISGVSIGGDVPVGAPVLTFRITRDKQGNEAYGGWEGLALPGRGGIVAIGLDVFTMITAPGSFFGGFVTNTSAAPRYSEMLLQGWLW